MSGNRFKPKLIIINNENLVLSDEIGRLLQQLKKMGHYIAIATNQEDSMRPEIAKAFLDKKIEFDLIYNWDSFLLDDPGHQLSNGCKSVFYNYIRENIKTNNPHIDISQEDTISFDNAFNEIGNPMLTNAIGLGYPKENLRACNQLGSLLPIELQHSPKPAPSYRSWKIGGAIIGCIIGAIVAAIVGPDMGLKAGIQTFIWWASLGAMGTVGGWFVGEELGENAALIQKAEPLDNRQAAVPGMGWVDIALQLSPASQPQIQASAEQNQSSEEQHELPLAASHSVQIPYASEASPWTRQRKMSSYNRSLLADQLAQHGHSPQPYHH